MTLSREGVDYARVAQAIIGMFALLVPAYGDLEGALNGLVIAVAAVVEVYLEIRKRGSTTPVADPKAADGTRLARTVR